MEKIIDISALNIHVDLIVVAIGLMGMDIVTGVIGAFIDKNFQSTIFRQGLFKKVYEIIIILVGYVLDYVLGLDYIGKYLSIMIIGLEAYSIVVENASEYVPIPAWLKNIIDAMKATKPAEIPDIPKEDEQETPEEKELVK